MSRKEEFCGFGKTDAETMLKLCDEDLSQIVKSLFREAWWGEVKPPDGREASLVYPQIRENVISRLLYHRTKSSAGQKGMNSRWKKKPDNKTITDALQPDNKTITDALQPDNKTITLTSTSTSTSTSTNIKQDTDKTHSITIAPTDQNGNNNGFNFDGDSCSRRVVEFVRAAKIDESAFFAPEHDPAIICAAIAGDCKSMRRWQQLTKVKGEGAVREEAYAMYREMRAGEKPKCRGAALNARLARLAKLAT